MKTEPTTALDSEVQRLRRWLLLLDAWNACLRDTQDAAQLAQQLCLLLLDNGGCSAATAQLELGQGKQVQCSESRDSNGPSVQQLSFAVQWQNQSMGSITLGLAEHQQLQPEEQAFIARMALDLACAIQGLASSAAPNPLAGRMQLLALAVEQSPFGVVVTDMQGQVEYCNRSFTAMSGFALNDLLGREPFPWNPSEATSAIYRSLLSAHNVEEQWQGDVLIRRKDGSAYWERQVVSTLHNAQGRTTHLIVVKEDISALQDQRREVEQALLLREQALVSSSNGIMITRSDADDHSIVYVNPAFERITGYDAAEVMGREGRFLVRDDLAQPDLERIREALRGKREGHAILRNYRKDGTLFWNELYIAPVHDRSGAATTHFVSVINDISERVRYQQALEYQATHDNLTGLANRSLLNDRIEQGIAWAKRNGHTIGLMLLDLDHFKLINDASGHSAGDALLKEVARRLSKCVRETDTVARLGGDEFVLILTDLPHADDVDAIAAKILSALARPFELLGRELVITASIGISLYPRDGDHGEMLLRYADMAMYRVKEHGRNSVRQFMPEMGSAAIARLDMEAALRRGLDQGEFLLHYQPKIELATQRIIGVEALVRWQHPQIGLVHPIEFIRLAEETGLIIPLGEWVLKEACSQLVAWKAQGLPRLKIAINMSARQFRQDDLAERIAAILEHTGADPTCVILELTESMVMQDVDSTLSALRALKRLGLFISLDDFGTGYSSLSYLRRFPIDELKIDRSFIGDIHSNSDDAAIAAAIVAMARSLGLSVVAEGVEKLEQSRALQGMGCDQAQGYFFARPLPADTFAARLRDQQLEPRP